MLLHHPPLSLSAFVTTILLARPIVAAFIPDLLRSFEDLQDLRKRCDNPCGYYGQLCCEDGESCYTDANNQAQCGPGQVTQATTAAAAGSWEYYTTTYVQTDLKTVTATFSSFIAQATLSCAYSLGESACGNVCCLSGQYCQATGQCVAVGGGSSGYYSSLFTVTTVITNTADVPLRPTSNTLVTVTTGTTTRPFETPVGTNGAIIYGTTASGSGGLSGGAIAGIVIGVIAGIILLLLLCACLCFKGLIDGILAIFGLGKKRKRTTEEEVYVERHSHRSGRSGVHNNRRTWFGTRPARTDVVEEKKSSGIGRAGWVAATLGGLALFLGMKRRNRKDDKSSTGYGSSYYSDYTVSSSESSSDRRTRRSSHHSRSRSRR